MEGNISVPTVSEGEDGKQIELDMVFADEQTKLYVSKKDIATSEELPGNTLSIYEYAGDGTNDEVKDADYGELVETWVSENEPHYVELLPHGTYILKEEQAVEGYTVAQSVVFRVNDTGVEQKIDINNEHEAGVADELVETMGQTGDFFPLVLALIGISMASAGAVMVHRRRMV